MGKSTSSDKNVGYEVSAVMMVSRQESFRLCSRSILMAILGLGFLFRTPVSAVADVDAKVKAFIKADSVNDSNARFLDVYESLDGDREKIVKALVQHGFTCAKNKIEKTINGVANIRCVHVVCKRFGLGWKDVIASVGDLSTLDRVGYERGGDQIHFYRKGTDSVAAGAIHWSGPFFCCPRKSKRKLKESNGFKDAPEEWEIVK